MASSSAGAAKSTARPNREGARSSAVRSRQGTISQGRCGGGIRSRTLRPFCSAWDSTIRAERSSAVRSAAATPAAVLARSRRLPSGTEPAAQWAAATAASVTTTSSTAAIQPPGSAAVVGLRPASPPQPQGPDQSSARSRPVARWPITASTLCAASSSTSSASTGEARRR